MQGEQHVRDNNRCPIRGEHDGGVLQFISNGHGNGLSGFNSIDVVYRLHVSTDFHLLLVWK